MDRRFRKLKLTGLFTALVIAGYASLAQAGPVNDQMLAADAGAVLAAYQRQLGGAPLQHADAAERQQCQRPQGRLGILARRQDRRAEHPAIP